MKLHLLILAQAVEDVLRFELGLPLVGSLDNAEDIYEDALVYVSQYPTIMRQYYRRNRRQWLEELEDARAEIQASSLRNQRRQSVPCLRGL